MPDTPLTPVQRMVRREVESRIRGGETVTELAARAKVQREELSRYMHGRRQIKSDKLERVLRVLGLSVHTVEGEAGTPNKVRGAGAGRRPQRRAPAGAGAR